MKPPGHDLRAYTLRDFAPEDVGEVRRVVCDTIDACYQPVYPPEAVEYFRD